MPASAARCLEPAAQAESEHLKQRYLLLSQNYEAMALEAKSNPDADPALKLLDQAKE